MAKKCKSYGVTNVLISGIAINNRLSNTKINEANQKIANMCNEKLYTFIDNSNIGYNNVFEDGLHLEDSGKRLLAINFINSLNNFLCYSLNSFPPEAQ